MTTPAPGPPQADSALASIIQGGDLFAAFAAAIQAGAAAQQPQTNIVVEFYDNFWNPQGFSGGYIQTQVSFPRLKLPAGQMTLKGDDPIAALAINCENTFVPVTVQIGSLRWAGWVDVAEDKINEDSTETVDCQIPGLLTMLDRLTVWPEPALPIEIQPSEAIFIGQGLTCLRAMVAENAERIQGSWNTTVNAIGSLDLDLRTWFDTWNLPGEEWITTPIFVPPWNPTTDTSNWIFFHGRMDTCWKLMKQQLQDNGWYASLDIWLPGDPQPDTTGAVTLEVPTYVFNVRDYSGVTGPSASWTDGLATELVAIQGAILGTEVIGPISAYVPPGSNIVIAPAYGVNYKPPFVIFNGDADESGLISMNVAHHAPQASRLILGGQSPAWLSAALNATMAYGIDMITILIGVTGIPDDLLNGILDGTFLAFQLFINYTVQQAMGPYGPMEKFFPTNSTYDIDMIFSAIDALWTCRGYPAAQFSFINGLPYAVGRELFPAAQASLIRRGILYTDYMDDLVIVDNNDGFAKVTVQVGDGQREDPPGLIWQRRFVSLEEDVNLLLLAPPGGQ